MKKKKKIVSSVPCTDESAYRHADAFIDLSVEDMDYIVKDMN